MWGPPDTSMWRTYVHITVQDIESEFARMYGIVDKTDAELDIGTKPWEYFKCSPINPPLALTCYTCSGPLDSDGNQKLEEMANTLSSMAIH